MNDMTNDMTDEIVQRKRNNNKCYVLTFKYFSYIIKIKVNEYVKLKPPKMNLWSQYIYIFNIVKKINMKMMNDVANDMMDEMAQ